jgi:uncharacterized protein YgfB (UPF0149 family)
MTATSPDALAFEKACIQRTQALVEGMRQNVAGLEMLNRVHARLEEEIRDVCFSLETIARLRTELWAKHREDFERTEAISEIPGII